MESLRIGLWAVVRLVMEFGHCKSEIKKLAAQPTSSAAQGGGGSFKIGKLYRRGLVVVSHGPTSGWSVGLFAYLRN